MARFCPSTIAHVSTAVEFLFCLAKQLDVRQYRPMSVFRVSAVFPRSLECPPLSEQALTSLVAGELAGMFKALSDPVRLRLLSMIAATDEVCVCDLTDAFEVTGATISHHLRVLRESRMVDCERRGTWMYYRAHGEVLDLLATLLASNTPAARHAGMTDLPVFDQEEVVSANPDVARLLADPLRARIVEILADGPATTSHLVVVTGAKQPNISGHIKQLREAGVIRAQSRGRYTYYRLVPETLRGAALHLADLAARARISTDHPRTT
jgi:ArsR family transcriptional regulator